MKAAILLLGALAFAAGQLSHVVGDPDVSREACYRYHPYGGYQRSAIAACKVVCDADNDADACRIVAWDNLQCSEGYARLNGPGDDCELCTTDDHFAQHGGCGVECSDISCGHHSHQCTSQRLYENNATDPSLIGAINHTEHPFYAALFHQNAAAGTTTGVRPNIAATNCDGTSHNAGSS